ncbi:hypothetical protein [Arcobacter sp. LA11]|uniref:hypothetical protein n=1 Tax=Arcobacter sp. LA11 TaxID=1898176 RepID=UPI0009350BDF|nr:hypothetical protein [Arcobacter sp. LA11]
MFYIVVLLFVVYFVLTLASIVAVLQEEVFYSKKEKIKKIFFILFVPFLASIIELIILKKYSKYEKEIYKDDIDQNTRIYDFLDEYTTEVPISSNDSAS